MYLLQQQTLGKFMKSKNKLQKTSCSLIPLCIENPVKLNLLFCAVDEGNAFDIYTADIESAPVVHKLTGLCFALVTRVICSLIILFPLRLSSFWNTHNFLPCAALPFQFSIVGWIEFWHISSRFAHRSTISIAFSCMVMLSTSAKFNTEDTITQVIMKRPLYQAVQTWSLNSYVFWTRLGYRYTRW